MSGFNALKNRKLWFAISAIIIIAGFVCAFVFGVGDVEFTGSSRWTAPLSEEFDPEDTEINELEKLTGEAAGSGFTARLLSGYTTTGHSLELTSTANAEPDLEAVKAKVNEAYPDAEVGDFAASKLTPSKSVSSALVLLGCFALAWLAAWAAAVFAVGVKDSVIALLAVVHDTLLITAIFIILRSGSIQLLIACALLAAAISAYLNIIKLTALSGGLTAKKNDRESSALAAGELYKTRSLVYVVFAALLGIALAVTSLCMGGSAIIPLAILAFFALVAGVYSSACITPNIWSMRTK